jgi:hypothetical protein
MNIICYNRFIVYNCQLVELNNYQLLYFAILRYKLKVMKKVISILTFIFTTIIAVAQTGTVSGTVKANNNPPTVVANILLQQPDSTAVKGSITDSAGIFKISAKPGYYFIVVSATGFANITSSQFSIKENEEITLPTFSMKQETKTLGAVKVVATKKLFEMQPDKMVMNIENSVLATGNSLFDVLRKAPAVTTDKDDNIKLKGAISQIFIDGKPAYLSGQQLTDYLKSLPADAVSKIEIITNPSSKYDAAGATGIINIKLKKNQAYGLNGTANVGGGVGVYGKINGGVNLNYRKNKVNIFGSGYVGNSESYNRLTYNSIINNNGNITLQDRDNYWHPHTTYSSYKTGLDYSISKKRTIGILYRGSFANTNARTDNNSIISDANHNFENAVVSVKNGKEKTHSNFFNLNYRSTLDSAGSELSFDADYANYIFTSNDVNENHFFDDAHTENRSPYFFRNIQPANGIIKAFKADYTKYLKNKLKIETGFKLSNVKSDNELIADSLYSNNWIKDAGRTDHFIYNENIYAAYLNVEKTINKTSIQAGIRAEQTNSTGNSITLNRKDKRSYLDLFPTLFISQDINDNNQLNFSYTRRISRPGYQSLNPFVDYIDPYTLFKGNPYLKPSYTNSFEIKHSYHQLLFTSLSYSHSTDVQTTVIRQDKTTGVTTNTTENAGYSNALRLDITASIPITKWWTTDNNIGVSYNKDYSSIPEFSYNTTSFSADFSTSQTFTLPKSYKIQTSFYYGIPTKSGIVKTLSYYGWDFGVQKQLWKNKATIKLNATNIIGTSAYRAHYLSSNLNIYWKNEWEGKKIMVSFIYKFGSNKIKSSRSHTTASQDEQDRIK